MRLRMLYFVLGGSIVNTIHSVVKQPFSWSNFFCLVSTVGILAATIYAECQKKA